MKIVKIAIIFVYLVQVQLQMMELISMAFILIGSIYGRRNCISSL